MFVICSLVSSLLFFSSHESQIGLRVSIGLLHSMKSHGNGWVYASLPQKASALYSWSYQRTSFMLRRSRQWLETANTVRVNLGICFWGERAGMLHLSLPTVFLSSRLHLLLPLLPSSNEDSDLLRFLISRNPLSSFSRLTNQFSNVFRFSVLESWR